MKVRTNYTGCDYITAGKIYDAITDGILPEIINDVGNEIVIYYDPAHPEYTCAHLDNEGTWEILPDAEPEITDADYPKVDPDYESMAKELAHALEGLNRNHRDQFDLCFCDMAIGNPMYTDHGPHCKKASAALSKYRGMKP